MLNLDPPDSGVCVLRFDFVPWSWGFWGAGLHSGRLPGSVLMPLNVPISAGKKGKGAIKAGAFHKNNTPPHLSPGPLPQIPPLKYPSPNE